MAQKLIDLIKALDKRAALRCRVRGAEVKADGFIGIIAALIVLGSLLWLLIHFPAAAQILFAHIYKVG